MIERAPGLRTSGQQVDVAGVGLEVVKLMGIDEAIRACRVKDDGLKFVDSNGAIIAAFPLEKTGDNFVREAEIMRPDFAQILYDRTNKDADYIFGDYITKLEDGDTGITVTFAKSRERRTFDLVVAADGLRGQTRDFAFGTSNTEIVSLQQYAGYFTIPWIESDGSWTKVYNLPSGRCVVLRPAVVKGTTGAYFCQITKESGAVAVMSAETQKQEIMKRFRGSGWETERLLKELEGPAGDSFYLQEIAQTKSRTWVSGRVALLGDSGYCPSPVSGEGTTLALVGAYVLAGCIATYPDHREALLHYEKDLRPFVERSQKLLPGVPWIVNPQSALAISVLRNVLWVAGIAVNTGLTTVLGKLAGIFSVFGSKELKLPKYEALLLEGP